MMNQFYLYFYARIDHENDELDTLCIYTARDDEDISHNKQK